MSISSELTTAIPEVMAVTVNKSRDYHGEKAVYVRALLDTGKFVEGTFTSGDNTSFGGVQFSQNKDIVHLMKHKINSVLKGTSE